MPDFQDFTSSEDARRRKASLYLKRRLAFLTVVSVLLASFGGIAAFARSSDFGGAQPTAQRSEASVAVASESTSGSGGLLSGDEPLDVLLLGVDKRPDGGSEGMGVRSDTIMVARVMPSGEIKLLSIPRDLYVEVSEGEKDRINTAYAYGGVDQARAVVRNYTGIDIDHYAVMDFAGFEDAVDAIGGVNVEISEGQYPENWKLEPGKRHLNGKRALMYARYRYSGGGDFDRIGHQQQILSAVKKELFKVETVSELPELVGVAESSVESDIGIRDAITLTKALAEKQSGKSDIEAFTLKGEGTYLDDGRQVVTPSDDENREIISDFLN